MCSVAWRYPWLSKRYQQQAIQKNFYANNPIGQIYLNRLNFDPSERSELSSIHATSSFIYKSLHVRQLEMSAYPSRYSGISLHSQRARFSSLHPDSIRFTLPVIQNRNKKKSFKI